jgi:serine/threonine-protein kinase RsbW
MRTLTGNETDRTQDRLALRSRLSDLAQVPSWTEALASRYSIPGDVQFAMDLCLEEVLSNIIRHGYVGAEDRSLVVRFSTPRDGYFVLIVEDEAPHYNPLDKPELPLVDLHEENQLGGRGIRLLRRFSDTLDYEPTPTGNRLRIGFSALH